MNSVIVTKKKLVVKATINYKTVTGYSQAQHKCRVIINGA